MKELSIEGKATRYDQAIKLAKSKIKNDKDHVLYEDDIIEIFPELKESEDEDEDEKIRKSIIAIINNYVDNSNTFKSKMIAWLEKQGEKKSADKVEPKFKVGDEIKTANEESLTITKIDENGYWSKDLFICGFDEECIWDLVGQKHVDKVEPKFKVYDWVVRGDTIAQILDIQEQYYVGLDINGKDFTSSRFLNDDKIHLWTIKDVKAGDVLVDTEGSVFIFRKICEGYPNAYGGINIINEFAHTDESGYWTHKPCFPATKEQRELLFSKMEEAGYEWDAEKKELKKIEQKPAWSEEDEMIALSIEQVMNCASFLNIVPEKIDEIRTWLKHLKDRYRWKPSDEQMNALSKAIAFVFDSNSDVKHSLESLYNELKKL